MKNFIQKGCVLTLTAPADVKAGDFILVGKIGGVAATDAAQDDPVEVLTEGVFEVSLTGAAVGDPVYWDGSAFTLVATAHTRVAVAVAASAGGKTRIKLDEVIA